MCVWVVSLAWRDSPPRTPGGTGAAFVPSPVPLEPALLVELVEQPLVVEIAGGSDDAVPRHVRLPMQLLQVRRGERGHGLARPDDGEAVGVLRPERGRREIEDLIVGRVVEH